MSGPSRRDALAVLLIALTASLLLALPPFDRLRGVSIDSLTWLRWTIAGTRHDPARSPAVVVALDEETYNSKPFEGTPIVTWTREIGIVLTALIEGGAAVVGFDVIFPTSIEQSEMPFADATLGETVRGFDRDYLRALAAGTRSAKVVLGQVQHQEHPIRPSPGQRAAVGQQRNIRALNFHNDPDDVVRRVPLSFSIDGERSPSMAVELAARALGAAPVVDAGGQMTLAGYTVPGQVANTLTLNFEGGADDIPTHALVDLRACAEKRDSEYFRRHFEGRVVLIGTVLDVEDRKVSSKRLATGIEGARTERCALPPPAGAAKFARDSISGVYIHATAVNNLLRREALRELPRTANGAIGLGLAMAAAGIALAVGPATAVLALVLIGLAWTMAATWAFNSALVLPLLDAVLGAALALAATVGYRFVVSDKDKRLLRRSFALYLAPSVIERMMAAHKPPSLGGETRDVTVFFSDIAGFSTFAERMTPTELVTLMNDYLSAMTDIIEAHGGFVDKYIGDAIAAVFGAPLEDPRHAVHAVLAAMACRTRLEEMNGSEPASFKGMRLAHRIGLNSGAALVGNIGSRRRFNYTAMGDAVNLAARLEGANKHYATTIIASARTVELAGPSIAWRELDHVRVAGLARPITIYEPLGKSDAVSSEHEADALAYAEGLARWRAADFPGAADAFARVAGRDLPAARFLARAQRSMQTPPGPGWDPVHALDGK